MAASYNQEGVVFDISIVKEEYEVQEWDEESNTNEDTMGDYPVHPKNIPSTSSGKRVLVNQSSRRQRGGSAIQPRSSSEDMEYITDLSLEEIVQKSLETMTRDKFFNCCVRFKRFKYNGPKDVRKHIVIHMRNRPSYPCQFCHKTFLWEDSQLRHQVRCSGMPMNGATDMEHPVFGNLVSSLTIDSSTDDVSSSQSYPSIVSSRRDNIPEHFSFQPSTNQSRRDRIIDLSEDSPTEENNSDALNFQTEVQRTSISCTKCPIKLNDKTAFEDHMRNHEMNKSTKYVCRYCGNKYKWVASWKQHEEICKQIKTKPKFSCQTCGNRYHEKVSLLGHKLTCRKIIKNYSAGVSGNTQPEKLSGERGANVSYPCGICGNTYKTMQIMRRHKRKCQAIEGTPKYSCDNCGNRFHRQVSMVHHKNVCSYQMAAFSKALKPENTTNAAADDQPEDVQNVSEGEYEAITLTCHTCSQTFINWTHLMSHQRNACTRVEGTQPYCCGFCKKGFNDEYCMDRHYRICANKFISQSPTIVPDNAQETPTTAIPSSLLNSFKCPQCRKEFTEKKVLEKHMIVHKPNRPRYSCEICGNMYLWKNDKENHKKQCAKMHKLPTLQCQYCQNKYHTDIALNGHMRFCKKAHKKTQENQSPSLHEDAYSNENLELLNCSICGKMFSKKDYLKIHIRTHTKPGSSFACDLCGNLYRNFQLLKTHRKECQDAEGVPKCVCLICGNRFHDEHSMEEHRKTCSIHNLTQTGIDSDSDFAMSSDETSVAQGVQDEPINLDDEESDKLEEPQGSSHDVAENPDEAPQTIQGNEENLTFDECLEKSLKTKTPDKFVNCCICQKRYKCACKSDFKDHMYTHFKDKLMFSCRYCGKKFHWKSRAYLHEAKCPKNTEKFTCGNCGSKFCDESSFKQHQGECIAPKPKAQDSCKDTAEENAEERDESDEFQGKSEDQTPTKSNQQLYRCKICSTEFKSRYLMVRHSIAHMQNMEYGRAIFSCISCGNRYLRKNEMRAHEKKCQIATTLPTFPCEICGNMYYTEDILRFHVKTCNGLPMAAFESIPAADKEASNEALN
uniref:C2H2-type domain-containing protein n=2 Tax=Lutzomyia longipalpis TaxID=7200 RepID=A0A1B0C948_LUTLO